jgi:RNA polymerase sigma-70 factor (ECF subfamily)
MRAPPKGVVLPLRRRSPASDDGDLVRRLQQADDDARAELFRRYANRVTAMLVRLLGSRADAEDAAQEAFVQALTGIGRLRDANALVPWLMQLAVRQGYRRLRRRRLLAALGFHGAPPDGSLERVAHPGASTDTRAELALLDRTLTELPAKERTAWVLRYVEGYELTEVAELCDCSLATAKRRVATAMQHVAEHVSMEGADE